MQRVISCIDCDCEQYKKITKNTLHSMILKIDSIQRKNINCSGCEIVPLIFCNSCRHLQSFVDFFLELCIYLFVCFVVSFTEIHPVRDVCHVIHRTMATIVVHQPIQITPVDNRQMRPTMQVRLDYKCHQCYQQPPHYYPHNQPQWLHT